MKYVFVMLFYNVFLTDFIFWYKNIKLHSVLRPWFKSNSYTNILMLQVLSNQAEPFRQTFLKNVPAVEVKTYLNYFL